jgi:hypothetical protein
MSVPRSLHGRVLTALGVLALAAFAVIAPGGAGIQTASAQNYHGFQLCNGAYIPSYQTCYSNGYGNGYSNNYSSTYTTCPNGQIVYTPQTCPQTSYPSSNPYCNAPYAIGSQSCCFNGYSGYSNGYNGYSGYAGQYCPSSAQATYPSGWNIVSGPAGTTLTGSTGPLYTFAAGAGAYQILPAGTPLQAGVGYWAYFPSGGSANFGTAGVSSTTVTVQLPPGQFVMIGNPGGGTATVSGANAVVLTFNPTSNNYTPTSQLAPGQGAWVASQTGGTITITSSSPPPPPPPL